MKYFLLIPFSLLVITSCNNVNIEYQNGHPEKLYPNGDIHFEYKLKDGNIHGFYKEYFEDGNLKHEGLYSNGLEEGEWIEYYDNGVKLQVNHYEKGKLHGSQLAWHNNGQLAVIVNYKNDKEDGRLITLDVDSDTLSVEIYKCGELISRNERKESEKVFKE